MAGSPDVGDLFVGEARVGCRCGRQRGRDVLEAGRALVDAVDPVLNKKIEDQLRTTQTLVNALDVPIDRTLASPHLKSLILANSLYGKHGGPYDAGTLFGLLFHVTRSLPLCMGAHMGWNFTQGTVWGIPVSGGKDTGWLVSVRTGPDWLSGGAFGAEASVVAVAVCSLVSLALLSMAVRAGTIVPPWFARRQAPAQAAAAGDNDVAKAAPSC